jgi:hypothetical protein
VSSPDDHASKQAPFSGDETGDIFGTPDVVWQSPTTTERVVDTQSGFLVVVRKVDSRFALSVKRRLGTPPVSSILLTPDESLKLSKILAGSSSEQSSHPRLARTLSPEIEQWLNQFSPSGTADDQEVEFGIKQEINGLFNSGDVKRNAVQRGRSRKESFFAVPTLSKLQAIAAITLLALGIVVSSFAFKILHAQNTDKKSPPASVAQEDPLDSVKVDGFARRYVSDMLDFNPDTYRVSQVQAMSAMVPELLERYWTETNFPLAKRQLKTLPQGQTVLITQVSQTKLDDKRKVVDIFAELRSLNSKIISPVHLKLTLGSDQEGKVRVVDQKDLTADK